MSQDVRQAELHEKTQRLLQGPLKHVRAAALAAALLPLASVLATPAYAQSAICASGGFCGFVWNDTNQNGVQDGGETGVVGASVTVVVGSDTYVVATDDSGFYDFGFTGLPPGTYEISVQIPPGTQTSPPNAGSDDTLDSDGEPDSLGNSVATLVYTGVPDASTDFGFFVTSVAQPGTGTPGYWKNHPEAWPQDSITVGGVVYTKAQALALMETPGKDKTLTMFSSLVSATLNVMVGNDSSCVATTIAAANSWMSAYGPAGRGVHASSFAWKVGEPLHRLMDNYNNGMLCAPHRD